MLHVYYNQGIKVHMEESYDIIIKGLFAQYYILKFFKEGRLNEWERDFYIDMLNQYKIEKNGEFMTLKQKKRLYLINRKLGKKEDLIIRKMVIVNEVEDAEFEHYFKI